MNLDALNQKERMREELKIHWWGVAPVLTILLIWKIIKEF